MHELTFYQLQVLSFLWCFLAVISTLLLSKITKKFIKWYMELRTRHINIRTEEYFRNLSKCIILIKRQEGESN